MCVYAVLLLAVFACFVVVVVVVLLYACYCEALRAQTRWGALEVLFIIIIIIMCVCFPDLDTST